MVSFDNGRFTPMPFKDLIDPTTGRTRVRMVDVQSEYYKIAREYMVTLNKEDLDSQEKLEKYAAILRVSPEECRQKFSALSELVA